MGWVGAGVGPPPGGGGGGGGRVLPKALLVSSLEGRPVPTLCPTVAGLTPVRGGVVTVTRGAKVVRGADAPDGLREGVFGGVI